MAGRRCCETSAVYLTVKTHVVRQTIFERKVSMVSQKHEEKVELREKAPSWRRPALAGVKAVHSLLYFAIEFCMGYLIYAGLKGREDRRTAMAAGVVGAESLIFLGNRCRCPLTGLAENLGADSGSVTDIYLPGFLASHLVLIHMPLLALALCLHVRNFLAPRQEHE